ncbi:hypothetical protein [Sedimentibacter sp. B4]|uniref:hypothetical protein n=1 Tax=Sedimentibacter sp. B4 TaxID=304766 RepID=UPI0002EA98B0|nr:hypothetical protein [Sedimentibacter sp. B4]
MHCEYNEKISYMKECIQKKNKLKGLLKQTEQDMIREKLLLNKLASDIEKQNQDVLKIESTNTTSLFYAILGDKEEDQTKERQELLKARLRYDQCIHNVEYLAEESKRLVDEIAEIDGCEADYEDLINKKLEKIHIEAKETGEEIKKLIKRKEGMKANIKEIDEAIASGEEALNSVEKTIYKLERAEGWGTTDVKGHIMRSASENISPVDEARKYAEESQRMLSRFKKEISDIIMITGSEISVTSFDTFADYFFDGLIYDWVVLSDIGKSLDTVKNIKNQTDKAMSKLYEEKVTEEFMINQIEEQINRIIENA